MIRLDDLYSESQRSGRAWQRTSIVEKRNSVQPGAVSKLIKVKTPETVSAVSQFSTPDSKGAKRSLCLERRKLSSL